MGGVAATRPRSDATVRVASGVPVVPQGPRALRGLPGTKVPSVPGDPRGTRVGTVQGDERGEVPRDRPDQGGSPGRPEPRVIPVDLGPQDPKDSLGSPVRRVPRGSVERRGPEDGGDQEVPLGTLGRVGTRVNQVPQVPGVLQGRVDPGDQRVGPVIRGPVELTVREDPQEVRDGVGIRVPRVQTVLRDVWVLQVPLGVLGHPGRGDRGVGGDRVGTGGSQDPGVDPGTGGTPDRQDRRVSVTPDSRVPPGPRDRGETGDYPGHQDRWDDGDPEGVADEVLQENPGVEDRGGTPDLEVLRV